MILNQYGIEHYFTKQTNLNLTNKLLGRVTASYGYGFKVILNDGEVNATIDNKLLKNNQFPAVGDFVELNRVDQGTIIIINILPRNSKISRKNAGTETTEQVFASNFDYVFIFSSLNMDFNLRKMERYLITAYDSGATPVIILSKADLCEDVEDKLNSVKQIALGIDIHPISSIQNMGIETLNQYLQPHKTILLFGSSGVGKSTFINTLVQEELLLVNTVREGDDRGRHTTTHRELFMLPNGTMIIDSPGIRELALWKTDSVDDVFNEIQSLSEKCKFGDCTHTKEPGCAVLEAIKQNEIDVHRYQNYLKLKKEAKYIETKTNQRARIEEKQNHKKISKYIRNRKNEKY